MYKFALKTNKITQKLKKKIQNNISNLMYETNFLFEILKSIFGTSYKIMRFGFKYGP